VGETEFPSLPGSKVSAPENGIVETSDELELSVVNPVDEEPALEPERADDADAVNEEDIPASHEQYDDAQLIAEDM
jgi:hypothetical protein